MTTCSELVAMEELVLGTIEPARAEALRAHADACAACCAELALLTEERVLFTHRALVVEVPPPALGRALRERLAAEALLVAPPRASILASRVGPARRGATRLVRRGASALGRILLRGQVTAACVAALVTVVAFSRLGGGPMTTAWSLGGTSDELASGPNASLYTAMLADEPLACSLGASFSTFHEEANSRGSGGEASSREIGGEAPIALSSSGAATSSPSSSGMSLNESFACGGRAGDGSRASCEPSVTCSSLRQ